MPQGSFYRSHVTSGPYFHPSQLAMLAHNTAASSQPRTDGNQDKLVEIGLRFNIV